MSSIPLLLQNDHVLYGALAQLDALSGRHFLPKNSCFGKPDWQRML